MREIALTRGLVAIVDDEDYERLSSLKWRAQTTGSRRHIYASTRTKDGVLLMMHREIAGALPGESVDHENGDTLDNRRCNVRRCTRSQNGANVKVVQARSGYKGVHVSTRRGRPWRAAIMVNKKSRTLGYFDDPEDAARVYDAEAKRAFGKFAATNESLGLLPQQDSHSYLW